MITNSFDEYPDKQWDLDFIKNELEQFQKLSENDIDDEYEEDVAPKRPRFDTNIFTSSVVPDSLYKVTPSRDKFLSKLSSVTEKKSAIQPGKGLGEFERQYIAEIINNMNNNSSLRGPQGIQGIQGHMGPPGKKGERGCTGERGIQGPQGQDGRRGEIGPIGPMGVPGVQGIPGIPGPEGLRGERGIPGPLGPPGKKGDQGIQGLIGPAGCQGIQGPSGRDAAACLCTMNDSHNWEMFKDEIDERISRSFQKLLQYYKLENYLEPTTIFIDNSAIIEKPCNLLVIGANNVNMLTVQLKLPLHLSTRTSFLQDGIYSNDCPVFVLSVINVSEECKVIVLDSSGNDVCVMESNEKILLVRNYMGGWQKLSNNLQHDQN